MKSPVNVAHLTSVHPRHDIRIFLKQCRSLAKSGYSVSLVVADGKGDEVREGVHIRDVGACTGGRLSRMTKTTKQVFKKAVDLDADIYHLHDPELLPVALKLKKLGKKIIFDSHEDYALDILTKPYLGRFVRIAISRIFSWYEHYICSQLDFVIAATPSIAGHFKSIGCDSLDVNNYPLPEDLGDLLPWTEDRDQICYVGAMTSIRGVPELVDAMHLTESDVRLALIGRFTEAATEAHCMQSLGWAAVKHHGFLDREEVRRIMENAVAGIVTFLPAPNHIEAQPNKMFEYMAAGIPVIGSNFPLWRAMIEGHGCGICVDPAKPGDIAAAIDFLYSNQNEARTMGECGRAAVLEKYNWDSEAKKLTALYEKILGH